jgi:hypothetical protein
LNWLYILSVKSSPLVIGHILNVLIVVTNGSRKFSFGTKEDIVHTVKD